MMPRRKITFNKTDVRAMWKLMKDMGEEPAAVRVFVDGSVRLLAIDAAKLVEGGEVKPSGPSFWDKVLEHDPT